MALSARVAVASLRPGQTFRYRLSYATGQQVGTVVRVERGARGGHVVILTDGTRLTFDAGQYVEHVSGVAS